VNVQITIKDRIIAIEAVVRYSHKFEEGLYKEPAWVFSTPVSH